MIILNIFPCKKCLFLYNCKEYCEQLDKDEWLIWDYFRNQKKCIDCETKDPKHICTANERSLFKCEYCSHYFIIFNKARSGFRHI